MNLKKKDNSYSSSSKLSYCHQITAPNGWGHFRCQVQVQNTFWVVYPFAKEVSPKINELQAITFYDERASDAQTHPAPPKRQFLENKKLTSRFFGGSTQRCLGHQKPKKLFGVLFAKKNLDVNFWISTNWRFGGAGWVWALLARLS